MPKPSVYAVDYVAAVNDRWSKDEQPLGNKGSSLIVVPGRIYDRIEVAREGKAFQALAFVVRKSGDLVKAATYEAPQKNPRTKELAVRYRLANVEDFQKAVDNADSSGGFLYEDYRRRQGLGPVPEPLI